MEICFEVGHVSIIRTGTTTNPTHDWKVFLRSSVINGDLNCLIERCVFHLHSSFINRKRGKEKSWNHIDDLSHVLSFTELKETPFAIKESGSEGFSLVNHRFDLIFGEKEHFRFSSWSKSFSKRKTNLDNIRSITSWIYMRMSMEVNTDRKYLIYVNIVAYFPILTLIFVQRFSLRVV